MESSNKLELVKGYVYKNKRVSGYVIIRNVDENNVRFSVHSYFGLGKGKSFTTHLTKKTFMDNYTLDIVASLKQIRARNHVK